MSGMHQQASMRPGTPSVHPRLHQDSACDTSHSPGPSRWKLWQQDNMTQDTTQTPTLVPKNR